MRIGKSPLRRGLLAASAALVAGGAVIAGVSVAGAAQSVTIYAGGPASTPCFATTANQSTCATDPQVNVTIQTGDTVTWDYNVANGYHNAYPAKDGSAPPDAAWDARKPNLVPSGTDSWTFGTAGVYQFYCQAHSVTMKGTITVEGAPVETATPTATPTPT